MFSNVSAEETPSLVQLNKTEAVYCLQLPQSIESKQSPQNIVSTWNYSALPTVIYDLEVVMYGMCCFLVCVCVAGGGRHRFFELLIGHDYFQAE